MKQIKTQDNSAGREIPSVRRLLQGPQNVCRVLCVVSDVRDFMQFRHWLGDSNLLALTWCQSPDLALDYRQGADLVVWQDHLFLDDQESTLRLLSGHLDVPVVVLGAGNREQDVRRYLMMGAADYLGRRETGRVLLQRTLLRCWYRNIAEKLLRARGNVDPLTGLLDRPVFLDRLQQALYRAEREKGNVTLCILNLDNFKAINQRFNFKMGDQIIRQVALRLKQLVRRTDSLARLSADEFGLVVETGRNAIDLDQVKIKLAHVVAEPFFLNNEAVELTASLGLVLYPEGGASAELLLRHVYMALAEAKKEQGNSIRIYQAAMHQQIEDQLQLEADFRHALRADELAVYYQPKIDVCSGKVMGMEALVRWPHPRRGMMMPGTFVPVAEKTGMIIPMGYWVLKRTCEDLAKLQALGFDDLLCSVNLSFRQFYDKKLSETVFRIIYNTNVDTTRFEFELTESSLMFDKEYTRRCMTEMTHLGIRFALDDFGTGYSSFSNLRNLPISTVKIDRSFVEHVNTRTEDAALVSGMITLSHQLGLTVVAEGVEDEDQLEFLRAHYCDQAQGYLIAQALPFDTFCEFLKKEEAEQSYRFTGTGTFAPSLHRK